MPQEKCQYCWGRGTIYRERGDIKCPRCFGRGKITVKKKK